MRSLLALGLVSLLGLASPGAEAAPKKATMLKVTDDNPAKIKLKRGSQDGVQLGSKGRLLDEKGNPVANGEFEVVLVDLKHCFAQTKLAPGKVSGDYTAVIDLP